MKLRILLWSVTSALAGFLFGFDTVVISGAEQTIQKLWTLSEGMHGFAVGSALYGTVLGSLMGSWPADRFGRKPTLVWVGVLYLVSAVGSAFAWDVWSLAVFRLIGGVGIGVSTVAAPMYIAEIAPPAYRGRLTALFQFNIVFGILVAFGSNALLAGVGEHAWRWMLGVEAVPAAAYLVACLPIPESPRWLLTRKRDVDAGLAVLRLTHPTATADELKGEADVILAAEREATPAGKFWSRRLARPILLAVLVAAFNQLSGINAVLYFAPRIFKQAGLEEQAALLNSVGIGVTNLVFTFVGLWLIDRLGRRTLLLIGSLGYIASLGLCAWAFVHWGPQFRTATAAIEVKEAVAAVRAEGQPGEKRDEKLLQLAGKKQALEAASRAAEAGAEPVTFDEKADPDAVQATAAAALTQVSAAVGPGGLVVVLCIVAFIAAHAVGQGAVIWVFISEIFPNRHRATGQAVGSLTHWALAAAITTVFPAVVVNFHPAAVFAFFAAMMGVQLLWVLTVVPETKGVPLEELEKTLTGGG